MHKDGLKGGYHEKIIFYFLTMRGLQDFSRIFLPLTTKKTRDENAPLPCPSVSILFGVKSIHDIIEGTKMYSDVYYALVKNWFAIVLSMSYPLSLKKH